VAAAEEDIALVQVRALHALMLLACVLAGHPAVVETSKAQTLVEEHRDLVLDMCILIRELQVPAGLFV
jgi:hypothetical protein